MGVNRIDMSMMREMDDRDFYHMYYALKGQGRYKSREDGIVQLMECVGDKPLSAYLMAYSRYKLLMQ
jgi:hypothetical protein